MLSFAKGAEVSEAAQAYAAATLVGSHHVDLEVKIAHAAPKAIDEARG